jgi:hypothetical protein
MTRVGTVVTMLLVMYLASFPQVFIQVSEAMAGGIRRCAASSSCRQPHRQVMKEKRHRQVGKEKRSYRLKNLTRKRWHVYEA